MTQKMENCTNRKKIFFRGTPVYALLFAGFFAAWAVFMYFVDGSFSNIVSFFIILSIFLGASLINFAVADQIKITFFSFLFFPNRIFFGQILSMYTIPDRRGIPEKICIFLNNGIRKIIYLGLYPDKKRQEIIDFISCRTAEHPEYYQDRESLSVWLKHARKKLFLRLCGIGLLLIISGTIFLFCAWNWDRKMSYWGITTAVIEQIPDDSGRETLRYRYIYQGNSYSGTEIADGMSILPSNFQKGSRIMCIVDPGNPEKSAVVPDQRSGKNKISGYFFLVLGILNFLFLLNAMRKRIRIPEELKDYITAFDPEILQNETLKNKRMCQISVCRICGPFQEVRERYESFPPAHSISKLEILGVLFLVSNLGTAFLPHFILVSILIAFLIWLELYPRCTIFDKKERKIYWKRLFLLRSIPQTLKNRDVLNFKDLTALGLTIRHDGKLMLSGVRSDGVYIPIATAGPEHMEQLFRDTVKIAERLGHVPVIII